MTTFLICMGFAGVVAALITQWMDTSALKRRVIELERAHQDLLQVVIQDDGTVRTTKPPAPVSKQAPKQAPQPSPVVSVGGGDFRVPSIADMLGWSASTTITKQTVTSDAASARIGDLEKAFVDYRGKTDKQLGATAADLEVLNKLVAAILLDTETAPRGERHGDRVVTLMDKFRVRGVSEHESKSLAKEMADLERQDQAVAIERAMRGLEQRDVARGGPRAGDELADLLQKEVDENKAAEARDPSGATARLRMLDAFYGLKGYRAKSKLKKLRAERALEPLGEVQEAMQAMSDASTTVLNKILGDVASEVKRQETELTKLITDRDRLIAEQARLQGMQAAAAEGAAPRVEQKEDAETAADLEAKRAKEAERQRAVQQALDDFALRQARELLEKKS